MFWKTIVISACGAVIFSLLPQSSPIAGNSQPTYTSESHFSVKRSSIDVAPDGDLSKTFWKNSDFVEFDQDAWGKSHYPEVSTRVKSLWTDSYIYFGFLGRYDSLNTYGDEDPGPERVQHYYEFEVAPNNQWIDLEIDKTKEPFNSASWNSGFEHATRIDAKNHTWTTEMRIPLAAINVSSLRAGTRWRANFFRAAGQGGDDHRKFLAWSIIPGGTTFHVPTRFGILEIVN